VLQVTASTTTRVGEIARSLYALRACFNNFNRITTRKAGSCFSDSNIDEFTWKGVANKDNASIWESTYGAASCWAFNMYGHWGR
jgi:hypothetical protein